MASLSSIPIPSGLSASKLPSSSSSSSPAAMISVAKLVPSTTSPKFKIISCSATNSTNPSTSHFAAVALALTIAASPLAAPLDASAEISGLTPCKESKAFAKREKQALKKLESSLKLYEPESAPALAIKATMEKTKKRFDNYGSYGLLCGADGLPHLIVSGDQRHWGEFITPGILFLYIAGWIGWVGRSYLIAIRGEKKPTMKEIIIDVPLASRLLWRGFIWPVAALREYVNGDLVVADKDVSVAQDL